MLIELQQIFANHQDLPKVNGWLNVLTEILKSDSHRDYYDPTDDGITDFKLQRNIRLSKFNVDYFEHDSKF